MTAIAARVKAWPRRSVALGVLVLTVALAIVPELLGAEAHGVSGHHLRHAVLIFGALIAGVLFCPRRGAQDAEHLGWLPLAVLAPVAAMFAMWPTTYEYVAARPPVHALEHLVIVALAFVAGHAGERYANGIGWVVGVLLELMAIGAAFGYGVVFGTS